MLNFICRHAPFAAAFAQGFERHIQPDFVAILETVRHRFGDAVNTHGDAFDEVFLDAFAKRFAGKQVQAQWR